MNRRFAVWAGRFALLAAVAVQGCGGAGYYLDPEVPNLVVTILSARPALSPGQSNTITVRVQNIGNGTATAPLIQVPGPIGFRYDSVTCLSAGAVFCPPISVQMLAAGIFYPSIPQRSELAFTFQGVAIGDVGTQISIAAAARLDDDIKQNNNSALLVIPVIAGGAPSGSR